MLSVAWVEALSPWRLFGGVLGLWVLVSALASALGFLAERALRTKTLFAVPRFAGQYRFELLGSAVFVLTASAAVTLALSRRWVHFSASTPRAHLVTFASMTLGFQVFYWFAHRAMHHRRLVFLHRWHHRSQVTTPLTGQSTSLGEALVWQLGYVGLAALLARALPFTFEGWVGYLVFNVFGNFFGHSNIEPTAPVAATRWATWFANAFIYHALHHARWTGHYSFQSALMDRLMGTEWPDWPALYAQIVAGRPLTSLKARG